MIFAACASCLLASCTAGRLVGSGQCAPPNVRYWAGEQRKKHLLNSSSSGWTRNGQGPLPSKGQQLPASPFLSDSLRLYYGPLVELRTDMRRREPYAIQWNHSKSLLSLTRLRREWDSSAANHTAFGDRHR